ncbi:MAG: trypsin-like peptidase domain-containing protein [Planctomycetota bacterium]|nr:trypsin-like peptidase domain-containing protein [Planctomycetota bacterium]
MLTLLLAALTGLAPAAPQSQELSSYDRRLTPTAIVARDVRPAVVYIESTRKVLKGYDFTGRHVYGEETSSGSGVVVHTGGYIVTNAHVVSEDSRSITVQFDTTVQGSTEIDAKGGSVSRRFPAKLLSTSRDQDLALPKVDSELALTTVRMGTSSDLMLGEDVIAIGNPLGQRLTVSRGIISGLGREIVVRAGTDVTLRLGDLIQTDAAINHGNSGGPLLNILGEMIGINTAVNESAENMGFAIPVDRVEEVLRDQLLAPESSRSWYGFDVDDAGTLCINRIVPGSPAALAGMETGYRLLAIDGTPVSNREEYRLARLQLTPNKPVRFKVQAAEGEREYELKGWNRVDGAVFERTGMTVDRCAVGNQASICVSSVDSTGPAHELGLQPHDIIDSLRLPDHNVIFTVRDGAEFARLLTKLPPGTALDVDILRDDDQNGRIDLSRELYKGSLTLR